ncbi:MAG: hypothetical protein JJT94_01450 [Bernardetiaceae bacterium]|nr:hypothetical protein [Bernardetiaceae bacterium]
MRKIICFVTVLAILAFSLTSCIDIKEKVKINKKGDGTYTMLVDWTQLQELMESIQGMGDSDEAPPNITRSMMDQQEEGPFSELVEAAEGVAGISNAKQVIDTVAHQIGISFDFDNVDALNEFLMQLDPATMSQEPIFVYKDAMFQHLKISPFVLTLMGSLSQSMSEDEEEESDGEGAAMAGMLMNSANYHFSFESSKKIRGFSNKKVKQVDKKNLELVMPFRDIMTQEGEPKPKAKVMNAIQL